MASQRRVRGRVRKIKGMVSPYNLKRNAAGLLNRTKRKSIKIKRNISHAVYDKPFTVVGTTFITGLCLGYLFKNRHY